MEGQEKKMQPEITKELLEQFNAEMSSEGPSKAATKLMIANNLAAGSAAARQIVRGQCRAGSLAPSIV